MKYTNNYLTNVLLRLDYNPLKQLNVQQKPDIVSQMENSSYKIARKESQQVIVQSGKDNQGILQQRTTNWILSDENKIFTLAPDNFSLEYRSNSYESYEEFVNRFNSFYTKFYNIYEEIEPVRLGLRYSNEIKLDGKTFDWSNYLDEKIIHSLDSISLSEMTALKSVHQLILRSNQNDDHNITFTYGMNNPDYPSPIAQKIFILDYDCSTNSDIPKLPDELKQIIQSMNGEITTLFENCIADDLRKIME